MFCFPCLFVSVSLHNSWDEFFFSYVPFHVISRFLILFCTSFDVQNHPLVLISLLIMSLNSSFSFSSVLMRTINRSYVSSRSLWFLPLPLFFEPSQSSIRSYFTSHYLILPPLPSFFHFTKMFFFSYIHSHLSIPLRILKSSPELSSFFLLISFLSFLTHSL